MNDECRILLLKKYDREKYDATRKTGHAEDEKHKKDNALHCECNVCAGIQKSLKTVVHNKNDRNPCTCTYLLCTWRDNGVF